MDTPRTLFLLALALALANAALTPPAFDTTTIVEYVSGPTAINGLACNGISDQVQCQSYAFNVWIKAPVDTARRRLIINSHYVRRTEHGGCFGFPGATNYPGYSGHQITDPDDPNHWDLTLSSTYDFELDVIFDQTAHDDSGVPRTDQRTWDMFWQSMMTQDTNTDYTLQTDPCATLSGASLEHCKRCTRCNGESDRGFVRTGVDVSSPAGTGTKIADPNTFATAWQVCYMLAQDDCFKPALLSNGDPWPGQLTYQLSAPDYSFEGYTFHSLTLHGDNFDISSVATCPYAGTEWTHTHPGAVADSDLAVHNLSFEFDVHEQPLTGAVYDQQPVLIETFSFAMSS